MIAEIATSVLVIYLIWFVFSTFKARKDMPPGPFPLPVIGNTHLLGKNWPFSLEPVREKYGDIYTVSLPVGSFVVVNSSKIMEEMCVKSKDDFAKRPSGSNLIEKELFKNKAIPFVEYGPYYIFYSKVITSALHMFGEGVQLAENRVQGEVVHLLERMQATNEQPFSPREHLSITVMNVTMLWLISERYEFGHPTLAMLREFIANVMFIALQWSFSDLVPFYQYLPTDIARRFRQTVKTRDTYYRTKFDEHRATYEKGTVRDIVDALLTAYDHERADYKGRDVGTSDDIIFHMMGLTIANSDNTTSSLTWFVLYMALYQEEQKKVHEELDRVVGTDRALSWDDHEKLPYLQATICEVLRHAFPLPIVGRIATRDTKIQGYKIPQDITILFNTWFISYDPREWDEPQSFRPERFLGRDGNFVGWNASSKFLPFGAGRRSCLGQALAKMNLFVIASNVMHRFCLEIPKGRPAPSLEGAPGSVRYPKEYQIVARKRVQ